MTSKPDNTRKADGRGRQGLRPLELFETIATEIERKHRAAQWQAEIPAEWTASVEQRVAREIEDWQNEMSGTAKAGASSAATRIAKGFATFRASFEGAYQSLMEAMFPGLTLGADAMPVRGGTRFGTVNPGTTGAAAPEDHARERSPTQAQEEARAELPAWIVVKCADVTNDDNLQSGSEFAILWTGEGPAPDLPPLELRLNSQPRDENVFWPFVRKKVDGLPSGKVNFVKFDTLRPTGFTILEGEDGRLVVDFIT